jgi:hypothetical protein
MLMLSQEPADQPQYTGASFDPTTGHPYVDPSSRVDFSAGQDGTTVYTERPGVPLAGDLDNAQSATNGVSGAPGDPTGSGQGAWSVDPGWFTPTGSVWYDSERQNAGYPLPVPNDFVGASAFSEANDQAAITSNDDFGIDDYVRFTQPDLNPTNSRITERTFDIPVEWKKDPTFPVQIQKPRAWDRYMGAWPWKGTKDAIQQPVTSLPIYYPYPLEDGIPSPGGAAHAMVPNTPSLASSPMTFRAIPEQWDTDFVYSGQ